MPTWNLPTSCQSLQAAGFDAQAIEPARPVVGGTAGFHDDQRHIPIREPALELRSGQAVVLDNFPFVIGNGQLEYTLHQINRDGSGMRFGLLSVAESLAPGWREQYTGPYLSEAKTRLANLASSNGSPKAQATDGPFDQNELYERQVKKATEQQQRMDQLLTVQEQHAKRFGAVLDRWEKQSAPRAAGSPSS